MVDENYVQITGSHYLQLLDAAKANEQKDGSSIALITKALKDAREYAGYYPEWVLDQILMAEAALKELPKQEPIALPPSLLAEVREALKSLLYQSGSIYSGEQKFLAQCMVREALDKLDAVGKEGE